MFLSSPLCCRPLAPLFQPLGQVHPLAAISVLLLCLHGHRSSLNNLVHSEGETVHVLQPLLLLAFTLLSLLLASDQRCQDSEEYS